ncbi:remorin-like isoform X1 [Oryza brachyantha]|uniref:remorin-like isoform X1 n=1 Tax=Oryza brachyantha TaxID=4533 RepID=UPI0007763D27|nr:remorin-like isoform X1 [Oryza brachyantha]
MAGEAVNKAEAEAEARAPSAPEAAKSGAAEEEKAVILAPSPASKTEDAEPPADDSKALVVFVEKVVDKPHAEKAPPTSNDRAVALAKVETDKRESLIKAWEDNEKAKAENRASKKLLDIISWENTKKAVIKTQLRKKENPSVSVQEELERKKAEYGEKAKNKEAIVHREAEEKRAMVMARRGEEVIKAEEMAAKYRATGVTPKKNLGCFGA